MAELTITDALKDMCSGIPWTITDADYDTLEWLDETIPKPTLEALEKRRDQLIDTQPWKELREERNKRLSQCDWVTLKAYSTGVPVPDEWKAYMQALRDLPANTEDPSSPTWPQEPTD